MSSVAVAAPSQIQELPGDPLVVRSLGIWGRHEIDVLVVPPDTDPRLAERALTLATESDSAMHARELLAAADRPVL